MTTVKASAENATVPNTKNSPYTATDVLRDHENFRKELSQSVLPISSWFGEQLDLFTIPTLYKPAPASTTLNPTCTPDNTQLSASPHHGRQEAK